MDVLKSIMRTPLEALVLGAREHALLAGQMPDSVDACFKRDDWTCHVCGIRIPGYMEVDHVSGHRPCPAGDLRTICQFCHNLRHALWSANRGRLRILWAPELKQRPLTILAWQVLLASPDGEGKTLDDELAAAAQGVAADAARRERVLADIIGAAHPGGLLESLFAVKRLKGEDALQSAVDRLDRYVRFWPAAARRANGTPVKASADFGHWRDSGFVSLSAQLISDRWNSQSSVDGLRSLFGSHQPLRA